ncbi:glycoside hydrolase [bacterium]|nr:MAG: glycoside hydrolase [bacterium]
MHTYRFLFSVFFSLISLNLFAQVHWAVQRSVFTMGDNIEWAKAAYNDSSWNSIELGKSWEDQGYWDLDGYAWYRVHLEINNINPDEWYWLSLGRLDDVDITYLNGVEIGRTGMFPPQYETAYHVYRKYLVKGDAFLAEKNILAVRFFDERLSGGWLENTLSIQPFSDGPTVKIPLVEGWRIKIGDDLRWMEPEFDDSEWTPIQINQKWETQGFRNYDGFAWYRLQTEVPLSLPTGSMILHLGKIDDADQVYVNGILIGGIGVFDDAQVHFNSQDYQIERVYELPDFLIIPGSDVFIAIRVFDGLETGGMYEGYPYLEIVPQSYETRSTLEKLWSAIAALFKTIYKALMRLF